MILVTGAAGYIGSHICEKLKKQKIDYIAIDNLSSGSLKNINNKIKICLLDEIGKCNYDYEINENLIVSSLEYYNKIL